MAHHGVQAMVHVDGSEPRGLVDRAETPVVDPVVRFLKVGPRQLRAGVVLPAGHDGGKLPVIMAPYGGPGAQKVMAASSLGSRLSGWRTRVSPSSWPTGGARPGGGLLSSVRSTWTWPSRR